MPFIQNNQSAHPFARSLALAWSHLMDNCSFLTQNFGTLGLFVFCIGPCSSAATEDGLLQFVDFLLCTSKFCNQQRSHHDRSRSPPPAAARASQAVLSRIQTSPSFTPPHSCDSSLEPSGGSVLGSVLGVSRMRGLRRGQQHACPHVHGRA